MKLGPEVVEQIPDSTFEDDAQNQESAAEESLISTDNADVKAQYMTVYETWCKHNRYKYLTRGSDRYCFHFEEDPLGLENFYPIGTPIVPIEMESEFKPGVPYSIVKHLQDDLNQLSQKKSKLRRMVHIKLGLPVADEKIKKLIESDDDIVVPMPELFSEALENPLGPKAIQQAIFEYPIEKVANSLNLLEQEKLALIEEYRHVLGLDDLMSHGKSSEQEGYHKSKLRAMFGNQRIAPIKWQVANAVRDMYDIANQIIFLHYPKDQIIKKSGNRNINSENPELDNLLSDKQSIPYTIDVEESTFKFKNIEENLALKTAMDTIVKDLETYLASADPDDYEMHLAYLEWRQAELDLLPLDRAIKLKANNAIDIMRERIEGNIQSEKEEVEAFVQQFLESNQGSTEKDAMKAYQEMKDQEKLESMAKFDKDYREQQSNETKEANQMALENKKLDQERDQKEKDREVQQEANNLKREEIRTNRQLGAQDIKVKKDANSITRKEVQIEEELGWKNVELKEKQINMGQSPSETPSPEVTGN